MVAAASDDGVLSSEALGGCFGGLGVGERNLAKGQWCKNQGFVRYLLNCAFCMSGWRRRQGTFAQAANFWSLTESLTERSGLQPEVPEAVRAGKGRPGLEAISGGCQVQRGAQDHAHVLDSEGTEAGESWAEGKRRVTVHLVEERGVLKRRDSSTASRTSPRGTLPRLPRRVATLMIVTSPLCRSPVTLSTCGPNGTDR